MPSLKDIKNRIESVKSTQKITSAMKMVAASKFRRAQEAVVAARPYAERMNRMLGSLAANLQAGEGGPKLMTGTGSDRVHLLVVLTSDRGLCGAFNSAVVRETRRVVEQFRGEGKTVKLLTIGRKGRDQLRRTHGELIVHSYEDVGRRKIPFSTADGIAKHLLEMFEDGEFDVCSVVYNKFKSAISQIVTVQQLVPFALPAVSGVTAADEAQPVYEFEPDEEQILAELLPRNLSVQVYSLLLESAASEQGAQMTAMDNATRNAGEMIGKLTITYNRQRQAKITTELIEIISGAEAL
jgi:F-type H+-transporting ATPase subunit gamma